MKKIIVLLTAISLAGCVSNPVAHCKNIHINEIQDNENFRGKQRDSTHVAVVIKLGKAERPVEASLYKCRQ